MIRSTAELLMAREIQGLRLILIWRFFFMFATAGLTILVGKSLLERASVSTAMTLALITGIFFFILVGRGKLLKTTGFFGVIFDVFLLMGLPFLWYLSVGGDEISRAYILKASNIQVMSFAVLVIHSLANRPVYTILITIGVLLNNAVYLSFALADPHTVLSSDFRTHMLGTTFSLEYFSIYIFTFTIVGVIVSYFLYRNRKTILDAVRLERNNEQIGRYFSPNVFRHLSSGNEEIFSTGGKSQSVAILFSDIRDFTSISEKMAPEEVVSLLSDYHRHMVDCIFLYGGTLDKFTGDGIMATFGTPFPSKEDGRNAFKTGIAMRQALVEFNKNRIQKGLSEIKQGIGIHYGEVIVGNIGTENRLEYTVIGDAVNIASRIENACRTMERDLLISESMAELVKSEVQLEDVGSIPLKGKTDPIRLFGVKG